MKNLQNQQKKELSFIRNYLNQVRSKCIKNQQAKYICVDKNCHKENPLICEKSECQCILLHEQFLQLTFKAFTKRLNYDSQQLVKLENTFIDLFDKFIDQVSQKRDLIINQIKQGKSKSVFSSQNIEKNEKYINNLKLTGSQVGKFYSSQQNEKQNHKLEIIEDQTKKIFEQFLKNQLQNLYKFTQDSLFNLKCEKIKIIINPSLSSKNNLITDNRVKSLKYQSAINDTLLQPSINKIFGKIVSWRVKIIQNQDWIGIGMCLRQFVKQKNFAVPWGPWNNESIHGHYIISTNNYAYAFNNNLQNSKTTGIELKKDDIIEIQMNKNNKTLKFTNQRTKKSTILEITHQVKPQQDEYHICVSLASAGDEVEILRQIKTQTTTYMLQENQQ